MYKNALKRSEKNSYKNINIIYLTHIFGGECLDWRATLGTTIEGEVDTGLGLGQTKLFPA